MADTRRTQGCSTAVPVDVAAAGTEAGRSDLVGAASQGKRRARSTQGWDAQAGREQIQRP